MAGSWTDVEGQANIGRCVTWITARLDDLERSPTGADDTARSNLAVVVGYCGAKRRSRELLAALGEALDRAGVHFDPDLTDLRLALDTVIRFSRRPLVPQLVDKELFPSEYGLEKYLEANLQHIPGLEGLRPIKTQFEIPGGERIDLLCEDPRRDELVIIELKRGAPDRGIVEQTINYTRTLRDTPFAKGRGVRAVIITGTADHRLQFDALTLATHNRIDLTWLTYDVALTITEVAGTGGPDWPTPDQATPQPERTVDGDGEPPRRQPGADTRAIDAQSQYGIVNPQSPAMYQHAQPRQDRSQVHFTETGRPITQRRLPRQRMTVDPDTTSTTSPATCPQCGSSDVMPIVYGLVMPHPDGGRVLGGCLVSDDDPAQACRSCNHRFGQRHGSHQ